MTLLALQDVLKTPETRNAVLRVLPAELSRLVQSEWSGLGEAATSRAYWEQLKCAHSALCRANLKVRPALVRVMLFLTCPRLDTGVSVTRKHLLKSPFSVHPRTGRVCVPISMSTVDTFDPLSSPTLEELIK